MAKQKRNTWDRLAGRWCESLERRIFLSADPLQILASFDTSTGEYLGASPILAGNTLYGTTLSGGDNDAGTVFSVPVSGGSPTILGSFDGPNGANPTGDLALSGNTLYGTTTEGGANKQGAVFSIPVTGGSPTLLASFNDQPIGLTLSGSTLFGETTTGGANDDGTIFSLPISGGSPTVLASFDGSNGASPTGNLTLSGNTLYGTTDPNGANGQWGTVFSVPVTGGSPTVLTSFDRSNNSNPAGPTGGLTLSGNTLYGTTFYGGTDDAGTVFSVPVTGGSPTVLGSFNDSNGQSPNGGLILSGNTLYGMANGGGAYNHGTVFSMPATGGSPTVLASFNDSSDGDSPEAGLIISGDTLYGTALAGGPGGYGTVFSLPASGGVSPPPANTSSLLPAIVKSSIPGASVGGAALSGTVGVTLTNSGATTVTGKDTVALYASTDGVIDSSSTRILSLSTKRQFKAGNALRLSLPVHKLSLAPGSYTLFAQVTDANGDISTSSIGATLNVATPLISLAGSISGVQPVATTPGHLIRFTLALSNSGNIASTGSAALAVGLSSDGVTMSLPITTVRKSLVIKPDGKPVRVRLSMKIPASAPVAAMNFYPFVMLTQGAQTLAVASTTLIAIG